MKTGKLGVATVILILSNMVVLDLYLYSNWLVQPRDLKVLFYVFSVFGDVASLHLLQILGTILYLILLYLTGLAFVLLIKDSKLATVVLEAGSPILFALGYGLTGLYVLVVSHLYFSSYIIYFQVFSIIVVLTYYFVTGKLSRFKILKRLHFHQYDMADKLFYIALSTWVLILFIHSTGSYIIHWDATVYHVVVANNIYLNGKYPVLGGTSHGLEMSSNYPPLYSSAVAAGYAVSGGLTRFPAKYLVFASALVTLYYLYKIVKNITGSRRISQLITLMTAYTPLFTLYSIYSTSYMSEVMFVTLSLYYISEYELRGKASYLLASSIFASFALLTNYHAMFYVIVYVFIILVDMLRKNRYRDIFSLIIPLAAIGSIWFIRNYILWNNPVFPFYQELFGYRFDKALTNLVFRWIRESSIVSFYGSLHPDGRNIAISFFENRINSPIINIASLTVLIYVLVESIRKKLVTIQISSGLSLLTQALLFYNIIWVFPRSFLPIIIPTAIGLSYGLKGLQQVSTNKIISAILILATLMLLTPGFKVLLYGPMTYDSTHIPPPLIDSKSDIIEYYEGPNRPVWYQGQNSKLWDYINENCRGGVILTDESKLYYVLHGLYQHFILVDSYRALPLLESYTPSQILEEMEMFNISCIYDSPWSRTPLWTRSNIYPMLGSPWMPMADSLNPTTLGELDPSFPSVYYVGEIKSSVVNSSDNIVLSLSRQGWLFGDNSITAIPERDNPILSDAPRIYVGETDVVNKPIELCIDYIDTGKGLVDIHLYDPKIGQWIYSYSKIILTGSGEVKKKCIMLPPPLYYYERVGVHSYNTSFTIVGIQATIYKWDIKNTSTGSDFIITTPILKSSFRSYLNVTIDSGKCSYLKALTVDMPSDLKDLASLLQKLTTTETGFKPVKVSNNHAIILLHGDLTPKIIILRCNKQISLSYSIILSTTGMPG